MVMPKAYHNNNQLINPWTEKELNVITTARNVRKADLLALLPNRTWSAIRAKRKKLHLRKPFLKIEAWNKGLTKNNNEIIARMRKRKSRFVDFATRETLIKERGKCDRCGYADTRILVLHHKDGNRANNGRVNFELLCPNCHTLEHLLRTGRFRLKSISCKER